ncbi:unnamed protein product [Cuscuta epithymum]|uniref:Myb/SANT-like domain-containing protein n=1 Tax=Cuscuta epithymum TaxID=186058 RepID=A0AAV0F227_9ASTE|nr:unnamed protein product [Cuscuta epithymum]
MSKRTPWNDTTTTTFLKICAEEKAKGNTKYDWNKIVNNLHVQTGVLFYCKKARNHFSELKDKYKAWVDLQNCTGINFDPVTGEVQVEERSLDRWKAYQEKHKRHGAAVAKKQMPYLQYLEALFQGQTAHGVRGSSPASARTTPILKSNVAVQKTQNINTEESFDTGSDSSDENESHDTVYGEKSDSPIMVDQSSASTKKRKGKNNVDESLARKRGEIDRCLEIVKLASAKEQSVIEKVAKLLDEMEVDKKYGDQYYVDAMTFLSEGNKGEVFVTLRSENQRWMFLQKGVPYGN